MTSVADLRDLLLAARNADGGWGYYAGKASRLEPTCWALMALQGTGDEPGLRLRPTLEEWPARDALLLERAGGEPNLGFHAVALLALRALGGEHRAGNAALVAAFEQAGGIRLPQSSINRQDNHLQGWAWFGETFSWVEPTGWGVLALKRWRSAAGVAVDTGRLTEPEALLLDRACGTGGWNYGNSNMLGRELRPYCSTTSIALLALQDRQGESRVVHSVEFLERQATWESSSYALSLAMIALRICGRSVALVGNALGRQLATTVDLGQQLGIAQALYALRDDHRDAAFTL